MERNEKAVADIAPKTHKIITDLQARISELEEQLSIKNDVITAKGLLIEALQAKLTATEGALEDTEYYYKTMNDACTELMISDEKKLAKAVEALEDKTHENHLLHAKLSSHKSIIRQLQKEIKNV